MYCGVCRTECLECIKAMVQFDVYFTAPKESLDALTGCDKEKDFTGHALLESVVDGASGEVGHVEGIAVAIGLVFEHVDELLLPSQYLVHHLALDR